MPCSYFDPVLAQTARAKAVMASRCETLFRASDGRAPSPADIVDEISVFGSAGWSVRYPADVRKRLNFLMPEGWDDRWRFPSLPASPSQRLCELQKRIVDCGWLGMSLKMSRSDSDCESMRRRLRECAEAGIASWVIADDADVADGQGRQWLDRLKELRDECFPDLKVECGLRRTDDETMVVGLLRTVDAVRIVGRDRTEFLRRLAECSRAARRCGGETVALNVGDHVFAGAALGHALGVTRYLADGSMAVRRAVRWQELSPAFVDGCEIRTVVDESGSIARGLPLPAVSSSNGASGSSAVLAAHSPNGFISVCATTPQMSVVLDATLKRGVAFGVFGEFKSVTFRYGLNGGERPRMVLASDLAGGYAENITANVRFDGGQMTLDGAHLARLGRKCNRKGDNSPPAVLIRLA